MVLRDKKLTPFPDNTPVTFSENLQIGNGQSQGAGELEFAPNHPGALVHIVMPGKIPRDYPGRIHIKKIANRWVIRNELPLELYAAAVADAETQEKDPAYLEVMTILVRTIASKPGPHDRDFCDRTCCMMYCGMPGKAAITAAGLTRDLVLSYDSKLCPVYFHACCAGHTVPVEVGIEKAGPHPALKGVSDLDENGKPWCGSAKYFKWNRKINSKDLDEDVVEFMQRDGIRILKGPLRISRSDTSSPVMVHLRQGDIELAPVRFRMFVGRKRGWNIFLSDRFTLKPEKGTTVIQGFGFGHRVGLCQAGALAKIRAGRTSFESLTDYFPGAKIVPLGPMLLT